MNEAVVQTGLQIIMGTTQQFQYRNQPQQFRANVSTFFGPVPGAFNAPVTGVDVDLTGLTVPGLCVIKNNDADYDAVYGIYAGGVFYPLGDVLRGEQYVIRLSQFLLDTLGTGTVDGGDATFHVRGLGGTCKMSIEAFEK